jgi:hypothetical protein
MRRIWTCSALGLGVLLAGCVSEAQIVQSKENMLAAAGFVRHPADTPARAASLAALPPDRMAVQARGNQIAYLFPDPLVCDCLWVGHQSEFARYQQMRFAQHLVNEQVWAAEMNEEALGPWGPGLW